MQANRLNPLEHGSTFSDLDKEHGFVPLHVKGRLPDGLRGTLYRVGPSIFQSHGERYGHWFDGDGAVSAVRLGDGRALGAARVVQSVGLQRERQQGRRLYGAYGTQPPGGPLARVRGKTKNVANTSLFAWDGKLFALFEAGRPTEIDPETLETLGESDLGGVVGPTFSAHPHWVPGRKAWFNFGVRYGKETLLDVYELPARGAARRMVTVPLAGATMIHDFIATERHLIFFAPPLRLRILRQILGKGTYSDNLAWRPELGTEVLVVPIDAPDRVRRFTVDPFYQWHFANAFERDSDIVVDLVRYPDFSTNEWLGRAPHGGSGLEAAGRYHRVVLDPWKQTFRSEEVWEISCEFPRVSPHVVSREHRLAWLAIHSGDTRQMFDTIARLDLESGKFYTFGFGEGTYPSEPVFVPDPTREGEDAGWVLSLVYDERAHRSFVAVFDGQRLADGPIAEAHFDHHIPLTFHGGFLPAPHGD